MFQQASMLGKRPISPKSEPMSPSNDDVSTVESSSNSSPLSPSSVDTAKDEEESRRQRLATGVYLSQRAQDRSTTHTLTTLQPMIITFVQEHRRTVAILWHSFAKQSTLDMVFNPNKVVWHFDHRRKHYAALMLTSYAFEYTLKKLRKWALRNGRGLTVPSTDGFPRATTCNVMCGVTMFEGQRDLDVNAPPSGTACLTLRGDCGAATADPSFLAGRAWGGADRELVLAPAWGGDQGLRGRNPPPAAAPGPSSRHRGPGRLP